METNNYELVIVQSVTFRNIITENTIIENSENINTWEKLSYEWKLCFSLKWEMYKERVLQSSELKTLLIQQV